MAILDLIVGGFIGTVVMTMMILYGYMMSLMPKDWNMIIDGMGKKMNDMMGVPASMAWGVHFLIGTIIHPLVYDSVWVGALGLNLGPYINEIIYAIIFAIIMIMMLGFLEAPREWRGKMAIGIIMAHIVYAIVLALFASLALFS
ncbi:MAG: hypothetical protein D6732_21385 [Methanobacteriota archaeon]|nr:MAG: hypothetical protein D6732_21385 [Euryarchaeota archaeon]